MTLRAWIILAVIAAAGWTAAGLVALVFVAHVGWVGLLVIGLIVLLASIAVDLNADHPAHLPSAHLMARQYEKMLEGRPEERAARFAERLERRRLLYLVRTFAIALVLLGGGMTLLH